MRKLLTCLAAILALASPLFAQAAGERASISGTVSEAVNYLKDLRIPLPYAAVTVRHGADSVSAVTNKEGRFVIKNLEPGTVFLRVSMLGYDGFADSLKIDAGQNIMIFTLKSLDEQLKSAKVVSDIPVLKQIKDTLVYNPLGVDTKEGDKALEILKQLPGFEINDKGGIKVLGEKVTRTYVNGKLIFGDEVLTPANILLASDVKDIRVYDETTDEARAKGLKNSRKRRVMNIRTHEDIDNAMDIAATAVLGAETQKNEDGSLRPRYAAGASAGYYSEHTVISSNVIANNLSMTSPTAKTIFFFPPAPQKEERKDISANLTLSRWWGDRSYGNSSTFTYNFGHRKAGSYRHSSTDYFATASSPQRHYEDTTSGSSLQNAHQFYLMLNLKKTPLKSIMYTLSATVNDLRNSGANSIRESSPSAVRSQMESTYDRDRNWDVGQMLRWSSDESILGSFFPTLSVDFSFGNSDGSGWVLDTLASSFNRRQLESGSIGRSRYLRAIAGGSGIISNTPKSTVSMDLNYIVETSHSRSVKTSWQLFGTDEAQLYQGNSFNYTYNKLSHGPMVDFSIHTPKADLTVGSNFTFLSVIDDENVPVSGELRESVKGNWFTPEPHLSFRHQCGLEAGVNTTSTIPSKEQIRPRIDDSNPLSLQGGNPALKPSTILSSSLRYSWRNIERQAFWSASVNLNLTLNPISAKSLYFWEETPLSEYDGYKAPAGATLFTYSNSGPAFQISPYLGFQKRFKFWKMTVSPTLTCRYSNSEQYIGNEAIRLDEVSPDMMVQANMSPSKWLRINVRGSLSQTISRNSNGDLLANYVKPAFKINPTITIAKYGYLSASYELSWYHRLEGSGSDFRNVFLYAYAGYRFFKGKLEVRLSGNDLLNTANTYTELIGADSFTQNWTPCFGRYVTLGVLFNFTRTNGRKSFNNEIRSGSSVTVQVLPF